MEVIIERSRRGSLASEQLSSLSTYVPKPFSQKGSSFGDASEDQGLALETSTHQVCKIASPDARSVPSTKTVPLLICTSVTARG